MIQIKEKKNCCGCAACANICPKNCILMQEDSEGFLYPNVQENKCVQCGACEKVCPVLNKKNKVETNKAYVSYASQNEVRLNSSSGGIFPLLAEIILDNNGIVFGAAFDENYEVHQIEINSKADLFKLCGSKYMQSRIEYTYYDVKKYLLDNKKVLYSGTACQIAGLKQYLDHNYKKLFTIDVLCHGVPSPKVWRRYLTEQQNEYGDLASSIYFRNKKYGWNAYSINIQFKNKKEYNCLFHEDRFMRLFLSNICLRPSCYNCKFKDINRISDITLGDCWGIKTYMPEMDDNRGTSVVITHSLKGEELLDKIKEKLVIKEAVLDIVLPPNADSRKSVMEHPSRKKFFEEFNRGTSTKQLISLLKLNLVKRMKNKLKKFLSNLK